MKFDFAAVRKCLKSFDFNTLFREHWAGTSTRPSSTSPSMAIPIHLDAVAQKRGFIAYVCPTIPDRAFASQDRSPGHQECPGALRHLHRPARRPAGLAVGPPRTGQADCQPRSSIRRPHQPVIALSSTRPDRRKHGGRRKSCPSDVTGKARAAFDVDKVTKKFYERFKAEHAAFLKFIKGIKADGRSRMVHVADAQSPDVRLLHPEEGLPRRRQQLPAQPHAAGA